ncbi:hypothetical protein L3V86_01600 [Thiotrichales bacterium 19S11-10]|nr:hypothetical protein [Thiotrichales bacterium 19S11-10]
MESPIMEQYQIILTLGIILILLVMIDTYRRIKRNKKALSKNETNSSLKTPEIDESITESANSTGSFNETLQFFEDNEEKNDENLSEDTDTIIELENIRTQTASNEVSDGKQDLANETQDSRQDSWNHAIKATRDKRFRTSHDNQTRSTETQEEFDLEHHLNQPVHHNSETDSEDNYLVFHIIAPRGYVFFGEDLNAIFNMRHYHYSIHNTYDFINNHAEVLFTIINFDEPKTFAQIQNLKTPGITLYCDIRKLNSPQHLFREILAEAHHLAESLGGMLTNDQQRRFTQADFSRYMAKVKRAQNNR